LSNPQSIITITTMASITKAAETAIIDQTNHASISPAPLHQRLDAVNNH
jgi:hypothetical protein